MSFETLTKWIARAALVAAVSMPLAAAAQQAVINDGGNLRAGPGREYPLVASLPPGTPATVIGCTDDYRWCDIVVPDNLRGWLYSGRLEYLYEDQRVSMLDAGAVIGVPIISFALDLYWSDHYRDRSWYAQPQWWGSRRPPPAAGWHRPPISAPAWRPRPPSAHWRPPSHSRPGAGQPGHRPPVARPPSARPPFTARPPSAHSPSARPPMTRPPSAHSPSARPSSLSRPRPAASPQFSRSQPAARPQRDGHQQRMHDRRH
ncbi:MAG: SH3 domain-containing protein [Burkholderiaceae bacterium]|nr:SH3 domain-containing protein [Burkholderiaceae bacterium]